ncbi:MAG: rod shape-determining protein MreC [Tepidisphaeraceae bacterium]
MNSSSFQLFFVALAALCAFTLQPVRSGVRETIAELFVPVAWPVHAIGLTLSRRLAPETSTDLLSPANPRNADDLRHQNAELLTRLANLEAQLDDLRQLSAQYDKLGALRTLVHPARVIAGPQPPRQTLTIATGTLKGLREKLPVVSPMGFAGQIYDVSLTGGTAKVLLPTDPASHLSARFVRFVNQPDGTVGVQAIKTNPPLVDGDGHGMVVRALTAREVRNALKVGDVALLDDVTFPPAVKGLRLGTVRKITLPATDAGFAVIELEPTTNFASLSEVLVVDK